MLLLEETKARLLTASEKGEDLLALISDLYVQEIRSNEKVLPVALSKLHNSNVIDIINILRRIDKSSCGRNFYSILNSFESALPTLDSSVEDVLHCLVHLKQQAGRDSPINGIYISFERYCSKELKRSRDSIEFILAQSELNTYAPFLSNSILAYNSDYVAEAIQIIESLIANRNEVVRNQAYFSLSRLNVDETKEYVIWDLISSNAISEDDNCCRASLLRAMFFFGEKHPSYWTKINALLITFLERESAEILFILSDIAAFQRFDPPESIMHLIVKKLTNVSSEQQNIIDNIDHFLVRAVERGETCLAVELLESILVSGVKFKSLDYFSNELINKYHGLLNHIVTKWLLSGEIPLCRSIMDLIHDATGKKIELKAEMALLDNEVKKIFVSRKVIGWLFTTPVAAASFILSISESSSIDTIKKLEEILYDPLLLSYPGDLKRFFQSLIDNDIKKQLSERLLARHDSYCSDIEGVFKISEFKAPSKNLSAYWKDFENSMQKAHEEASSFSFIQMLAKTQVLLYGNSSVYYMHQSEGKPIRQEMQMHTFSHSTEMPRLNVLDPVSLEYFLITWRCEKMNNEINS